MRKILLAMAILIAFAGAAAWYVFSWLPDQFRNDIEQRIASLAPETKITYDTLAVAVFDRAATFSGLTVKIPAAGNTVTAERMVLTVGGDNAGAHLLARNVALVPQESQHLTVGMLHLENVALAPPATETGSSGPQPPKWLKRIQALSFGHARLRKIAGADGSIVVERIEMKDLADGRFSELLATGITGAWKDGATIEVAEISARDIDIITAATLPRTFRGEREWSRLDAGPVVVESVEIRKQQDAFSLASVGIDGIRAGRIIRFLASDMKGKGSAKDGRTFEIGVGKLEFRDFPIITRFPASADEIDSFRMAHRDLVYGGFDIRDVVVSDRDGALRLAHFTMPTPTFRVMPSGTTYASEARFSLDLGMDISLVSAKRPKTARQFRNLLGRDDVHVTLTAQMRADHEERTHVIDDLTFSLDGLASLSISGRLGNLPQRIFETPGDPLVIQIATRQMVLQKATVTMANESLVQKFIAALARKQGQTAAEVTEMLAAEIVRSLTRDGDPQMRRYAGELAEFLRTPRTLSLSVNPATDIPILRLADPRLRNVPGAVRKALQLELRANSLPEPAATPPEPVSR